MDLLKLLENEPVEWKKLGEISDITGAGVDKKINADEKTVTLLNYMDIYRNVYIDKEIPSMEVTATDIKIKKCNVEYGDIFFTPSSETEEDIFRSSVAIENMDGMVYSYHIMRIRLKKINFITSCFLNYYFRSDSFRRYMFKKVNGNTRKTIAKSEVENLEVPIPSLEVQEKIVKTLDKFTEYVTELQTELQKRIDQYTYYRDTLLSEEYIQKLCKEMEEDRRVQVLTLSEIFEFKNGLNKGKEYFGKGIPFVSYMNVYKLDRLTAEDIDNKVDVTEDEIERFSVQRGDILFTRTSEVKDEVGYSSVMLEDMEKCVFNGFTIRGRLKNCDLLLPEFSAHLFRSYSVRKEIIKRSSFTTRASLSGQELGKVEVMIPPLSLQHKIATILDKFQTMIADAKGLLPTEIEQRQQQYKYYREKLLTFSSECDNTHARTHAR